jgi:ABC-type glycerol-3-phosphate transport system substrate-binding protein
MSYVRSNIPTCFDLALALAMAGCFASGLCGCRQDEPVGVTQIECWYPWGGEEADAMKQMTSAFEAAHPGYRVKLVYAANTLTSSQKLFLAIAGGRPPDVTFVDGQQLAEWAARGALDDITDLVLVPAYRESPWFEEARKDWRMAVFIDIVNNSGHVRTLMPAQGYLMDLLNVAVERALYGTQSPQAALDEATRKAQKRLDLLFESRYRRLGDK